MRYIAAACLANGGTIRLVAKPGRFGTSIDDPRMAEFGGPVTRGQWDACVGPVARSLQMALHGPSHHVRPSYEPLASEMERTSSEILVTADGRNIGASDSQQLGDDFVIFYTLPAWSGVVRLLSNAHPPRGHSEADSERRMFGVAILSIAIEDKIVELDSDAFWKGFYPIEGESPRRWRWTDGEGILVVPAIAQPRALAITLTGGHRLLRSSG